MEDEDTVVNIDDTVNKEPPPLAPSLAQPEFDGTDPKMKALYEAANNGSLGEVKLLFSESNGLRGWTTNNIACLFLTCVSSDTLYGIALLIRKDHGDLALFDGKVLRRLARKPDAFVEKSSNIFWEIVNRVSSFVCPKEGHPKKDTEALELLKTILKDIAKNEEEIDHMIRGPAGVSKKTYSLHTLLFIAAEMGNTKFIAELIRQFPDLIEAVNNNIDKYTIFHIAVIYHCEGIYNLWYTIDIDLKKKQHILSQEDAAGNTMLHLAANAAKRMGLEDGLGVTSRTLRGRLWFKEVESMIEGTCEELLDKQNKKNKTPRQLFTEQDEHQAQDSEKCMKGTASHCMVVAALFYTVVFAAAFAVPGGYSQTNGIPIFKSKATFMVFVVASAISLFSSAASILMFLSILISGYAKPDLLHSSKKLIVGLATLFLSTITMTITFSVNFFVLYYEHLIWVPVVISLFGVMPIFLFAWLICPLLADAYRLTYGSTCLFGTKK